MIDRYTPEKLAEMRRRWEKQWTPSSKKPPVEESPDGRYLWDEDRNLCNLMPNSAWVFLIFVLTLTVVGSWMIIGPLPSFLYN